MLENQHPQHNFRWSLFSPPCLAVFPAPALGLVNRVQQFLIIQKLVGLPHPRLPQILDFLSPKTSPEASLPVPQLDHASC
jgi:hypothetical protein